MFYAVIYDGGEKSVVAASATHAGFLVPPKGALVAVKPCKSRKAAYTALGEYAEAEDKEAQERTETPGA